MNIPDTFKEIKGSVYSGAPLSLSHDIFVILLIIFVALASFGLGRLSVISANKSPMRIESAGQSGSVADKVSIGGLGGSKSISDSIAPGATDSPKSYVASKTGKKYYFPWCGTALRIAEENKVWFATVEDARAQGYTPASNCKGLK